MTDWLDRANYPSNVGTALHAVRLDLGAWAGWLAYDAGRIDQARGLLHDTILSARLRDEPMAEVRALAVMSMVLHRSHRPKETLECALAAQRIARGWATPRLACLLNLRSARAYATLNQHRAFASEIAKAQTQLDHGPNEDDPLYVEFVTPHLLTGTVGLSQLALGKPARAARAFREAAEDPSRKRNVAYRTVHLAIATAQQGDLGEASRVGLSAIPLAAAIESDRINGSLHALRTSIGSHRQTVASVAEFTDALRRDLRPVTGTDVVLRHHDAASARPMLDDLLDVYLEVYAHQADDPFYREDRYRRQLTGHMNSPGWEMVTATADPDDELAGYIYGTPLPAGAGRWRGLTTPLPDDFITETDHRTFAIAELLVREPWRGHGIARRLHDELLAHRPEARARLLVQPNNTTAQAIYTHWGWRKVATLRPSWDNAPLSEVLILAIR